MSALRSLLAHLIDYAGLFPPAELEMRPAVENYLQYRRGPQHWMLGRFIVPASKLAEFENAISDLSWADSDQRPWPVSALIAPASQRERFDKDQEQIAAFNQRQRASTKTLAVVDTLEGKAQSADDIRGAAAIVDDYQLFLEIPWDQDNGDLFDELARQNSTRDIRAKIRSGGVVPEAIPSPSRVASFLAACAARDISFKATAGLHHPIRAKYRLTYRDDAPCAEMFGFLNVFVAACAAFEDPQNEPRIREILSEGDPSRFTFASDHLAWGDYRCPRQRIDEIRQRAVAFGSCSFVEPVDDLRRMKLLP